MGNSDLLRRCDEFASRHGLALEKRLGGGVQGIVFARKANPKAADTRSKIHNQVSGYLRERDAYVRLQELGKTTIRACDVPELIGYDDDLWIIVMSVVERPFVLDFGGAFLDRPPDFSEDILADWEKEKQEQFGKRWSEVRAIINELQGHGIILIDVNPGNISFGD